MMRPEIAGGQALAELERLRVTLEAAEVGTWRRDLATNRVEWSDNLETIHGLPRGSFGHDFQSFLEDVHPEDRERILRAIRAALDGAGEYQVEYRLPERDGSERWLEGKGRTFCDPAGRPVRMAGICMDGHRTQARRAYPRAPGRRAAAPGQERGALPRPTTCWPARAGKGRSCAP